MWGKQLTLWQKNREGKKKNTFCFHLFQVTKDMNGYGAYRRIEDKQIN